MAELDITQWRAFVGPRIYPTNSTYYYSWLSSIPTAADTNAVLTASTTLTATFTNGVSTTLACADASKFSSAGGVWVYGNGTGQKLEHIRYVGKSANTTLTGAIQESDSEVNSTHSSGAVVRQWLQLDTNDGTLDISMEASDTFAYRTWEAKIKGIVPPYAAIKNGHIVVIQSQERTFAWSGWTTLLIGVIDQPKLSDDSRRLGSWTLRIIPIPVAMMEKNEIGGIRVGDLDAATLGSATSSVTLGAVWKERHIGDYVAAEPSFAAASAIDGEDETLWISDQFLGGSNTPNQVAPQNSDYIITGMHLKQPPGQPIGYRWIEFTSFNGIVPRVRVWWWNGSGNPVYGTYSPPAQNIGNGKHIILAENPALFEAENPGHGAVAVIDASNDLVNGINPFVALSAAGGAIALWNDDTQQHFQDILWGTGSFPGSGVTDYDKFGDNSNVAWSGPAIAAPTTGRVMRFIYKTTTQTNTRDYWATDIIDTPGYDLGSVTQPWIKIDLPALGLKLRDAITSSSPGNSGTLYIVDDSGPSTHGLPSSGTIQIGDEQIAYTAKNDSAGTLTLASSGARAANSTTAAAHSAGDIVYYVHNGTYTDAFPYTSITLKRSSGGVYVNSAVLYGSSYIYGALDPTQTGWNSGYNEFEESVGPTGQTYTYNLGTENRLRTLLIRFLGMSSSPYRPRINGIVCKVKRTDYGTGNWTADTAFATLVDDILLAAKMEVALDTISGTPPAITDRTTAKTNALDVLTDLCLTHGFALTVELNSRLTIAANTPITGTLTSGVTWNRTTARQAEMVARTPLDVRQLKLTWQNTSTAETTVSYPTTANATGKDVEIGPWTLTDSAQALTVAQRLYQLNRLPYTAVIECATSYRTVKPGDIHTLAWDFERNIPTNRKYVVSTVDHRVEDEHWYTTVGLAQIDREVTG